MTAELPEAQQADYKKSIPAGRFASPARGREGHRLARVRRRRPTSPAPSSRSTAASAWATDGGADAPPADLRRDRARCDEPGPEPGLRVAHRDGALAPARGRRRVRHGPRRSHVRDRRDRRSRSRAALRRMGVPRPQDRRRRLPALPRHPDVAARRAGRERPRDGRLRLLRPHPRGGDPRAAQQPEGDRRVRKRLRGAPAGIPAALAVLRDPARHLPDRDRLVPDRGVRLLDQRVREPSTPGSRPGSTGSRAPCWAGSAPTSRSTGSGQRCASGSARSPISGSSIARSRSSSSTFARSRTGALASNPTARPQIAIIGRSLAPSPTAIVCDSGRPASSAHSRSASALAAASMIGRDETAGQEPVGRPRGGWRASGRDRAARAIGSITSWKPPDTTATRAAGILNRGDQLGHPARDRRPGRATVSSTDDRAARRGSRPARAGDSSKSISPFMARRVISATRSADPASAGEQLDDLVLDERRVDVEHHEEARHGGVGAFLASESTS